MPPNFSYIIEGTCRKFDGSTALPDTRLKIMNEKTGDSFFETTNADGDYITDLNNFQRGWQNGQTIKVEIDDQDAYSTGDFDFYIGTSHLGLVYNYQLVEEITNWKVLTADKGNYKINLHSHPNGITGLTYYQSPA